MAAEASSLSAAFLLSTSWASLDPDDISTEGVSERFTGMLVHHMYTLLLESAVIAVEFLLYIGMA